MNTTKPEVPPVPENSDTKFLPKILVQGFALVRRNWPFVVLAYAINLVSGLLAGVPLSNGIAPILDHSLAAQKISGTIDLNRLLELLLQLHAAHAIPMVLRTANWLSLLQTLTLFLVFTGTVVVYLSGEPPLVSVLVRETLAFLWRFVRAAILAGCVAGFLLGILLIARAALLARLALSYTGQTLFIYAAITGALIFGVALLLRLWFDLVELYVVRHARTGEMRVHRSLLPAWKLLRQNFLRLFGSFLLAGLAGVGALGLCLLLWKSLPADAVWIAAPLAQAGLFLLLASRFWQRGLEAALVLAIDSPAIASEPVEAAVEEEAAPEERLPSLVGAAGVSGLSEPTLQELVQKLRTEPWAVPPPAVIPPTLVVPPPEATPATLPLAPPVPAARHEPVLIMPEFAETANPALDRHAAKFPLGGVSTNKAPAEAPKTDEAPKPAEKPKPGKGSV